MADSISRRILIPIVSIFNKSEEQHRSNFYCRQNSWFPGSASALGLVALGTDMIIIDPLPEATADSQVELFSALGTLLGLMTTVSVFLVVRRLCFKQKKQDWYDEFMERQALDPNLPFLEQAKLLPYDKKWEFPKSRLKFGKTIGQGAFGKVVLAKAIGLLDSEAVTTVAVKMLKDQTSETQQKALIAELKILMHLGHHVNIMNLLGAVTKSRKGPLVIVEYCRYGNMRHYLLKNRRRFVSSIKDPSKTEEQETQPQHSFEMEGSDGQENSFSSSSSEEIERVPTKRKSEGYRKSLSEKPKPGGYDSEHSSESEGANYELDKKKHRITTDDLVCFSYQCSRGMEYLASRRLVHRDLAARNILLSDNKIIKICDFGLAKELYDYPDYIKKGDTPLPIKWMAIESIGDRVFTTKTDVWSFGILMWEFFTLGGSPYPGIEVDEKFYTKLKDGYRMEKPEHATEDIYKIMVDCWKETPAERPHFKDLSQILGNIVGEKVQQYYTDLNEPYMRRNQLALEEYKTILLKKGSAGPSCEDDVSPQDPCNDGSQECDHPQKMEDPSVEKTEDTLDHRNESEGGVEEDPLREDDIGSPTSDTSDAHPEGSDSEENIELSQIKTSAIVYFEPSAEDSGPPQSKSALDKESIRL